MSNLSSIILDPKTPNRVMSEEVLKQGFINISGEIFKQYVKMNQENNEVFSLSWGPLKPWPATQQLWLILLCNTRARLSGASYLFDDIWTEYIFVYWKYIVPIERFEIRCYRPHVLEYEYEFTTLPNFNIVVAGEASATKLNYCVQALRKLYFCVIIMKYNQRFNDKHSNIMYLLV